MYGLLLLGNNFYTWVSQDPMYGQKEFISKTHIFGYFSSKAHVHICMVWMPMYGGLKK